MAETRLDHGMLNLPLAKRGNIDAQIDRYKADQEKAAREVRRETFYRVREMKAHVRTLLGRIGDHRILVLAKPLGSRTPGTARKALYQAALSNLPIWIAALEREQFPAGGCATCWAPVNECDHTGYDWLGRP